MGTEESVRLLSADGVIPSQDSELLLQEILARPDAKDLLLRLLLQASGGRTEPARPDLCGVTVGQAWEGYRKSRAHRSPGYLRNLERIEAHFREFLPSDLDLRAVTPGLVASFYQSLTGMERSPYTLNHWKRNLRSLFEYAVGMEWVSKNPVRNDAWPTLETAGKGKRVKWFITVEEEDRLCQVLCEGDARWLRFIIRVPMRWSETGCLRWGALSDDGVLTSLPENRKQKNRPYFVKLIPEVLRILGVEYRVDSEDPYRVTVLKRPRGKEEPMFDLGSLPSLQERLNRACSLAGVRKRINPTALRRTFVERGVEANQSMAKIARAGGWASEKVVMDFYSSPLLQSDAQVEFQRTVEKQIRSQK